MKIKEIKIVTEITDIKNNCANVIVRLNNNFSYVINVVTPLYLLSLMKETN